MSDHQFFILMAGVRVSQRGIPQHLPIFSIILKDKFEVSDQQGKQIDIETLPLYCDDSKVQDQFGGLNGFNYSFDFVQINNKIYHLFFDDDGMYCIGDLWHLRNHEDGVFAFGATIKTIQPNYYNDLEHVFGVEPAVFVSQVWDHMENHCEDSNAD